MVIPLVAFVDDPREPVIDEADHQVNAHPGLLREVAKLVRKHTRELLQGEPGNQGEADREHEVVLEHGERPAVEVRRGVDHAIHLDPARPGSPDR